MNNDTILSVLVECFLERITSRKLGTSSFHQAQNRVVPGATGNTFQPFLCTPLTSSRSSTTRDCPLPKRGSDVVLALSRRCILRTSEVFFVTHRIVSTTKKRNMSRKQNTIPGEVYVTYKTVSPACGTKKRTSNEPGGSSASSQDLSIFSAKVGETQPPTSPASQQCFFPGFPSITHSVSSMARAKSNQSFPHSALAEARTVLGGRSTLA